MVKREDTIFFNFATHTCPDGTSWDFIRKIEEEKLEFLDAIYACFETFKQK